MNNRFKFRVWDTKLKKFLIGIPPMEYMLDKDEWDHRDCYDGDPRIFINNVFSKDFNGRLIFQQYTGLNDINSKEIYEGDIVNYKTWHGRHDGVTETFQSVVRFQNGAFYPRFIEDINEEDQWYSYRVYDLKVIGNEMEHKHLDENE